MTACFRRRSRTVIERLRQSSDARLLLWSFASWQERTSDRITWKLALSHAPNRVQSLRRQAVFPAWHMYLKRRMDGATGLCALLSVNKRLEENRVPKSEHLKHTFSLYTVYYRAR